MIQAAFVNEGISSLDPCRFGSRTVTVGPVVLLSALLVVLFALVLSACGTTSVAAVRVPFPLSGSCPPSGALVSFSQLMNARYRFIGCDVTTDVSFSGTDLGSVELPFDLSGYTVIRVSAPDHARSVPEYAAIYPSAFSTIRGQVGRTFRLRGRLDEQQPLASDNDPLPANALRIFRAYQTVQVAGETAVAATPPAAGGQGPGVSAAGSPPPTQPQSRATRIAIITDGPGLDAPAVQLAIRELLSRQEVVLLDSSSVGAARTFITTAPTLSAEEAARLATTLEVDRLLVIETRPQSQGGSFALQVLVVDRGMPPSPRFRSVQRVEMLQDEVLGLLALIPPVRPIERLSMEASSNGATNTRAQPAAIAPSSDRHGREPPGSPMAAEHEPVSAAAANSSDVRRRGSRFALLAGTGFGKEAFGPAFGAGWTYSADGLSFGVSLIYHTGGTFLFGVEVGYEAAAGPFIFRPFASIGLATPQLTVSSVDSGAFSYRRTETTGAVAFGPGLSTLLQLGNFFLGADLRAILIPAESFTHSGVSIIGSLGYTSR